MMCDTIGLVANQVQVMLVISYEDIGHSCIGTAVDP